MNVFLNGKNAASGRVPVKVTSGGALVQASDNGVPVFLNVALTTNFAALPATAGTHVAVFNNSGTSLVLDHGAGTATFTLPTGNERVFKVAANANELRVKATAGTPTVDMEVWG